MGAAPPRQTEFRVHLPGNEITNQIKIARDAYSMFGIPEPPPEAISLMTDSGKTGICMSIITSAEGFVRLGILCPEPTSDMVARACQIAGAPKDPIDRFQRSLNVDGPSYVEFQYLKEGFGYGVYPEGFDVVFHFSVADGDDDWFYKQTNKQPNQPNQTNQTTQPTNQTQSTNQTNQTNQQQKKQVSSPFLLSINVLLHKINK